MDKLELMHALADGQLGPEEQEQAERLAQSDPECMVELKWAREIKGTVAQKCKMQGDEEVWKASLSRLDALDRTQKTETFVTKYAWAFCAVVLVAILFGAINNRTLGPQNLSTVQVADLLNPVASNANSDIDPRTAQILDLRRFNILAVQDVPFENRMCKYIRLQDGFGGMVLLALNGQVSLNGIDEPTGYRGLKSGKINEANTVTWSMGEQTFVLAANRPTEELIDIVRTIIR